MLKQKYFKILFAVLFIDCFIGLKAYSQNDDVNSITQMKIHKLQLEARFDFDYNNDFNNDTDCYGFAGKFINIVLDGQINEKFKYSYRQRVLPVKGDRSFFDGTDWIYLSYNINKCFKLTAGKLPVAIGGFEYDAPPIDVYYWSNFWNNIICYELGVQVSYGDLKNKNTLIFQFVNSPYSGIRYEDEHFIQKGKAIDNKFCYSLIWYGNFKHLHTIYSVNMMQNHNNKFVNYVSLGNKLVFNKCSIYVDVMNRTSDIKDCLFKNYTLISRIDYNILNNLNVFIKGGIDRNETQENVLAENISDIFVLPGTEFNFVGVGFEYFMLKDKNIRLHSYVAYNNDNMSDNILCSIGLTWRMNFADMINYRLSQEYNTLK